jgi:hypothetical protein
LLISTHSHISNVRQCECGQRDGGIGAKKSTNGSAENVKGSVKQLHKTRHKGLTEVVVSPAMSSLHDFPEIILSEPSSDSDVSSRLYWNQNETSSEESDDSSTVAMVRKVPLYPLY